MKALHRNWNELLNDCMIIILVAGTIGIALKFTTFFDRWVYFPSFPNICDAAFLILSVGYLTWKAKRVHTTKQTNPLLKMEHGFLEKPELLNSSKVHDGSSL
jgi:cytochrome c oxidase assembly factor CtaG